MAMISPMVYPAKAQDITNLDFLIGSWDVSEVIHPGSDNEYIEAGIRTCAYDVDSTYIKCTIDAESKYGTRRLAMYINYDNRFDKFVATTLFSNLPFQGRYDWYFDSANQVIQSISPLDAGDDYFYRGEIAITDDQLVWRGYRTSFRGDRSWELRYVETSNRITSNDHEEN